METIFLPQEPIKALRDGNYKRKATLMFGITDDEGSVMDGPMGSDIDREKTVTKSDYKTVTKAKLMDMAISSDAADDIVNFYFSKSAENPDALFRTYTDVFGDLTLGCPTLLMAENVLQDNIVYTYHLTYKMEFELFGFCKKQRGVCHGQDMLLLFGAPFLSPEGFPESDRDESRNMIQIWTDFAKNDKVEWPALAKTNSGRVIPFNKEINLSKGNPTRSDFNYVACRVLEKAIYSINPKLQN